MARPRHFSRRSTARSSVRAGDDSTHGKPRAAESSEARCEKRRMLCLRHVHILVFFLFLRLRFLGSRGNARIIRAREQSLTGSASAARVKDSCQRQPPAEQRTVIYGHAVAGVSLLWALSAMLSRALNLPLRRERGRCVGQARQEPACNGRRCRRARRGNQAGAARAVWRRMCGEPGAERPFLSKGSPADRSRHSLLANCSHAHSS